MITILMLVSIGFSSLSCDSTRMRVATTTSLYDTGLWALLEPMFEKEYKVELDILYAGTDIAIEWGQRGDVDAVVVHSKASELAFVAAGYGMERIPFAYNRFVIVGPEDDPAGIAGMSPEDAFKALYTANIEFISRGDNSGTHVKEKAIWAAAGYNYAIEVTGAGTWYIDAGKGMGPTLLMASERQAYTLSDIGTYLAYQGDLDLTVLVEQGSIMLNVYSVIACNPENTNSRVNLEMAQNLVEFLISDRIQDIIGEYGVKEYGKTLFIPCAGNEPIS